ncbi:Selenocysteine lyase/Cysteine desulfurase [Cyclonatronum proteinivorum]|uniref:Selenocysteine lyase/Cysteine desulfurase n=1 Tax=Cyclonatronum proteinivorum TaxID=1457365 RepID=A0A345UKV3_9BACT|nr:aminotransferase class V-fold PLP-dependent enzyme [Cyclonatronum proteinivorum]AXJ01105.1 Selenocysteine lyase/Cysteine desulfurase [Cyclonatronum proteinivorum]
MSTSGFNPETYRRHFPHLHDGGIYFNHAALSPLPSATVKAVTQSLERRQHMPVDDFMDTDWPVMAQTREQLAALTGASGPDRIAFMPNTSFALSIIANGFAFEKGDEVLVFQDEFPSNVYPWLLQEARGVKVRCFSGTNGCFTPDDVAVALTSHTRIFAVSAVQFLSGFRADLSSIAKLCRANGTFLVVDAIQALGHSPVSAEADGIDALCAGCHKWLMTPQGLGFLYLSEAFQDRIAVTAKGWLSVASVWDLFDTHQPLNAGMSRFEPGTFNLPAIHGLHKSLELLTETGPENIRRHVLALGAALHTQLEDTPLKRYGPAEETKRSAIITFRLPEHTDTAMFGKRLAEKGLIGSVRNGLLRFSPYFYNTQAEVSKAADIIKDVLLQN